MAAIDPQNMKPAELMQVLNTAGRGTVLTETRLRRHRNRAGYTIGDARTINLFRYAAWLTPEYRTPKEDPQDYTERKRRQAERNAEAVRAAQDIGVLPYTIVTSLTLRCTLARVLAHRRRRQHAAIIPDRDPTCGTGGCFV